MFKGKIWHTSKNRKHPNKTSKSRQQKNVELTALLFRYRQKRRVGWCIPWVCFWKSSRFPVLWWCAVNFSLEETPEGQFLGSDVYFHPKKVMWKGTSHLLKEKHIYLKNENQNSTKSEYVEAVRNFWKRCIVYTAWNCTKGPVSLAQITLVVNCY